MPNSSLDQGPANQDWPQIAFVPRSECERLVEKSDKEIREAVADKFLKHVYRAIVCMGALVAHRESERCAPGAQHAARAV
jgi:glycerol dehydrogenase-like iron-containing ADH family enzyme